MPIKEDVSEIVEKLKYTGAEIGQVTTGIFDLGYWAGQIDATLEPIFMKQLQGKPITADDRKEAARLACAFASDLRAAIWHKPHSETQLLLNKLTQNQVRGEKPDFLCSVGVAAEEHPEVFNDFVSALREISDMLSESCGQSHMESIVGCIVKGDPDYCKSLDSWREARENVIKTGHKARIPMETIKRLQKEGW